MRSARKVKMHTSKFIRTGHVVDAVNWQFDSLNHGAAGAARFAAEADDAGGGTDYQRGLKQGLGDGFRAGAAHERRERGLMQSQSKAALDDAIGAMQKQFLAMENGVAEALTDMAFAIAGQVVRAELSTNPESIVAVAREALASLAERAMHPVIWLNPGDLSLVSAASSDALSMRGCRVEPDPAVTRGGCRVESDAMTIDATIETRWKQALASMGYKEKPATLIEGGHGHVTTNR